MLNFLGLAVKVHDDSSNTDFYMKTKDIVDNLININIPLSKISKILVRQRILEIANPNSKISASYTKLQTLFENFTNDRHLHPEKFQSTDGIFAEMEKLKLQMMDIPNLSYSEKTSEIASNLQPGDFFIRKYHEDNDNLICDLQKIFQSDGYREAYKCSHIAVYLGQFQGEHWIAEASMPHDNEPQIRRIKIDDARFQCKPKNQYIIIRNTHREEANELVRLCKNYSIKLLPENERTPIVADLDGGIKYNFFEAARSMWHSPRLGFFGRQRLFKYYADYRNGIPFEYLGKERKFFCSHFALMIESLSEMNTNKDFQQFMEAHPLPKVYEKTKTGLPLIISKLWYSIRKGVWSRWMSVRYKNEVMQNVCTHLDALRTSPQAAVNYMMDNKDHFQVVALVTHKGDYVT